MTELDMWTAESRILSYFRLGLAATHSPALAAAFHIICYPRQRHEPVAWDCELAFHVLHLYLIPVHEELIECIVTETSTIGVE